jgi:hypothetical protein
MAMYTVLVNSCDAYDDCWQPFFRLLKRFWPDLDAPIVLNTETKSFSIEGLNIRCEAGRLIGEKAAVPWAARLARVLGTIDTPFVLMTLDDFFIRRPVNAAVINEIACTMQKESIGHVMLSPPHSPYRRTGHSMLVDKGQRSPYRVSLQVGLWRPSCLMRYLRMHENPWQTEIYGTKRSWRVKERFCALDPLYVASAGLPIAYDDTGGIARGRWYREKVEDLFRENSIVVDFDKRGWYRPGIDRLPNRPLWRRALDRVRSSF